MEELQAFLGDLTDSGIFAQVGKGGCDLSHGDGSDDAQDVAGVLVGKACRAGIRLLQAVVDFEGLGHKEGGGAGDVNGDLSGVGRLEAC
ncbi:hypothetical protein ADL27_50675, partial [Streptomyces sp. NRRL F-6602]